MIKTIQVAARDRARLAEITRIASRFGLDLLLARIGLTPAPVGDPGGSDLPVRTRRALEALGPVWVKLGQILATRADLLPPEWIAAFEQLHSQAPRLPFDALRAQVEAALGEPPEVAFARFDAEPLAAASMAQVHRAALHDGREVVVKIRRPGIRPQMESDLRLLTELARIAEASSAEARRFGPVQMARQLGAAILDELDFTNEARNADRLREDFAKDARVVVPVMHWEWTGETLLVMDYVDGIAPRSADALRAAGIDPDVIAATGADIVLDMVLINGRFHGDPHPGNLLCMRGDRIALIDLGLVGTVSPRRREEFIAFVQALATGDAGLLADTLAVWSQDADVPRARIAAIAERLVARHGGDRLILAAIVADLFPMLREDGLALPPDLLLIFKALLTVDGVLQAIRPGFDLAAAVRRAGARVIAARLSPDRLGRRAAALAAELDRLGDDLPGLVRAATRKLEATQTDRTGEIVGAIARAARTVTLALIAAALIVALAIWLR